ncbi:MAG: hypothetical protein WDO24_10190 [Pseudomonadota bacterium]
MTIYEAAMRYAREGVPLIVVAGADYGAGSSRDWAAKGTRLLGVRAVIAEGFERIHRSNLIGMGVLPLQFTNGQTRTSLGLTGAEDLSHSDCRPPRAGCDHDLSHRACRRPQRRARAPLSTRYPIRARIFSERRHLALHAAADRRGCRLTTPPGVSP